MSLSRVEIVLLCKRNKASLRREDESRTENLEIRAPTAEKF